jgi:hypothetical protein
MCEQHLFALLGQLALCDGMNKSQLPGAGEWRQIIDGQPASGLTVAAYCRDRGIKDSSFYARKRRLRSPAKSNRSSTAVFVWVTPPKTSAVGAIEIERYANCTSTLTKQCWRCSTCKVGSIRD